MLDILDNRFTDKKGLFVHNNFLYDGEVYLREKLDISVVEDIFTFEKLAEGIKGKKAFDYIFVIYTKDFDNNNKHLNCILNGIREVRDYTVFLITDLEGIEVEENVIIKNFKDTLLFKEIIDLIRGTLKGKIENDDEGFFTLNEEGSKVNEEEELGELEDIETELEEVKEEFKEEEQEEEEDEGDDFDDFDIEIDVRVAD